MENQQLLLYGFAYCSLLIMLAWLAERLKYWPRFAQVTLYGMSLGVYCSSWTFLGAVGNAAAGGWSFLPIYLGPILLFLFGWPFVRRLLVIGARNKVTSIADFIGSRYGKDQHLAALVTLVAVIGTLPYIALQLRAIALAWSATKVTDWSQAYSFDSSASLFAAVLLGWFAIVFGTQVIDGPHRHRGLLSAVAFESIIKLIAFVGLAIFAVWLAIERSDINIDFSGASPFRLDALTHTNFYTQMLLAAAAIICLPRQFHVMVVEYHDRASTRLARWLFPLYLLIFAVCVIPIVEVGRQILATTSIPPDIYVLALPGVLDQSWLSLLAFIGTLSAATGMVLLATIALSIMVSNELIVPLLLYFRAKQRFQYQDLGNALRNVRRLAVALILGLSWILEVSASSTGGLASMGLLAFASSAQLLPAIVAGLYWPKAHRHGVFFGILFGWLLWSYCLLLPALLTPSHPLITQGPWDISWLTPYNLFGSGHWLDPLSHGVVWSLGLNALILILLSKLSIMEQLDTRQANAFIYLRRRYRSSQEDYEPTAITVQQLQSIVNPLLDEASTDAFWNEQEQKLRHRLLPFDKAPRFVVTEVENKLAPIIGSVSAHKAIDLLRRQKPLQIKDIASLMGGTSRQLHFSQGLLQATLENIPQGISVVDEKLNLVAWNEQYERLFDYPPRLLFVGCPIERIYRYNAKRGLLARDADNNTDEAINKRLEKLRSGIPYRIERRLSNESVVEIRGTPIPSGGYATAYTDVTAYHQMMNELEQSKTGLELRVAERTAELSDANESLQEENTLRARIEQELQEVHASKSRFLAAASHDLLQPINAARLLVEVINRRENFQQLPEIHNIDSALASAEAVVNSLREIARLDSGKLVPNRDSIRVASVLDGLAKEFGILAQGLDLQLHYCPSQCWVYTDKHLLRRIIQNFLSNALRYTRRGKVLLGCRRRGNSLTIEVWDTGPGISKQNQQSIFEEFERIDIHNNEETKGLGLGLSIASRIAQLLGHVLEVESWVGRGSVFRLTLPLAEPKRDALPQAVQHSDPSLKGLHILCIDNEPHMLAGLQATLSQWGCNVTIATSLGEAMQRWQISTPPDLILADYHLDNNETGLDVLQALSLHYKRPLPALVISADNSSDMRDKVRDQGYQFLAKPVQASTLRLTLRRLLRTQQ